MRDSSFGAPRTDLPRYDYGVKTKAGDMPYKGEYEMPYSQALAWGNHATGYALAPQPDASAVAKR